MQTRQTTRGGIGLAIAAAAAVGLIAWPQASPAQHARRAAEQPTAPRLTAVTSWTYQLQRLDDPRLTSEPSDLLVIDYSIDGSEPRELWPSQIERFKARAGGGRRIVLAYLSVGEAEDYRFYWQAAWDARRPDWFLPETCRWQGNHVVHFWREDWKRLIYRGAPGSHDYLARIQNAGFDGVYLDRVDAYAQLGEQHPRARAEMVRLVVELAAVARTRRPGFLVVAQNGEELLADRTYRGVIDGVAKEDLLYGLAGDGRRNPAAEIGSSVADLKRLRRDGKPVLTVEYLAAIDLVAQARAEHTRLGFVPTFTGRALQGGGTEAVAVQPATTVAASPGVPNPCR